MLVNRLFLHITSILQHFKKTDNFMNFKKKDLKDYTTCYSFDSSKTSLTGFHDCKLLNISCLPFLQWVGSGNTIGKFFLAKIPKNRVREVYAP